MNQQPQAIIAMLANLQQQLAVKANEDERLAADYERLYIDIQTYKTYQLEKEKELIEKLEKINEALTQRIETTVTSNTNRVLALEMQLAVTKSWLAGLAAACGVILVLVTALGPLWVVDQARKLDDQHIEKYHNNKSSK